MRTQYYHYLQPDQSSNSREPLISTKKKIGVILKVTSPRFNDGEGDTITIQAVTLPLHDCEKIWAQSPNTLLTKIHTSPRGLFACLKNISFEPTDRNQENDPNVFFLEGYQVFNLWLKRTGNEVTTPLNNVLPDIEDNDYADSNPATPRSQAQPSP
jgi:hypothetical protein